MVTLWAIWGARRKAIHEGIFQSPFSIHGFITSYLSDLHVLKPSEVTYQPTATSRPKRWIAPPSDCSKFNVDAAVGRSGTYGAVETICRNHEGVFLGASAVVYRNIGDPTTLEALAVREALALVEDLYQQHIHIASDCKVVVDEIKGAGAGN